MPEFMGSVLIHLGSASWNQLARFTNRYELAKHIENKVNLNR